MTTGEVTRGAGVRPAELGCKTTASAANTAAALAAMVARLRLRTVAPATGHEGRTEQRERAATDDPTLEGREAGVLGCDADIAGTGVSGALRVRRHLRAATRLRDDHVGRRAGGGTRVTRLSRVRRTGRVDRGRRLARRVARAAGRRVAGTRAVTGLQRAAGRTDRGASRLVVDVHGDGVTRLVRRVGQLPQVDVDVTLGVGHDRDRVVERGLRVPHRVRVPGDGAVDVDVDVRAIADGADERRGDRRLALRRGVQPGLSSLDALVLVLVQLAVSRDSVDGSLVRVVAVPVWIDLELGGAVLRAARNHVAGADEGLRVGDIRRVDAGNLPGDALDGGVRAADRSRGGRSGSGEAEPNGRGDANRHNGDLLESVGH